MRALLRSLWGKLWLKLAPAWPVLLLLAAAAALTALGLNDAVWLDRLVQPGWVVWPGLLCGLLLARTRWPGWFTALYSLLLSTAVGIQTIGQPLPAPAQMRGLSFLDALLLIDQRLEVLVQRIGGWLQLARQGLPNFDSGLPLLLLLVLGWNLLVWLAWFTRRGRPFIGLLPAWLLLAVVSFSSGQNLWLLAYFALVSLLLLAVTHYRERIALWEHRRVDFPDGLSFEWTAAAATLALGVMLFTRAAPLAFSPQGWQQVRNWLEPPAKESTPPAHSSGQPGPRLLPAASIDLNVIGAHLPTGDETVLWVGTNEPPPPPPQAGLAATAGQSPLHYWRGGVMAVYTGRGWQPAALDLRGKQPTSQTPTLARHYALEQTIEIPGTPGSMAFAANEPFEVAGIGLYATIPDGSLIVVGMSNRYRVISWVPRVDAAALRSADPQHIPPDLFAAYTQLPASLPQRVRDLANRITQGEPTAYDQSVAVQDYLRKTYPYDLGVAPAAAGADVVDDFLFETRAGFCSHFASAMAVLLRAQGVPARVAVGYLNGDYDYSRAMYRIPASAAHAWVEVYFAGYGWIEFEPTPAFQAPQYNRTNTAASTGQIRTQSSPALFNFRQVLLGAGILAGAGVLVLLLAAAVRFQRGFRGSRNPARRLYWRLRSVLAWGGCSAPANVTPLEFLGSCQPTLGAYPRLQETAGLLTGLYLRDRFTPAGAGAGELEAARARWRSVRVELGKWLIGRWWKRYFRERITTESRSPRRRDMEKKERM